MTDSDSASGRFAAKVRRQTVRLGLWTGAWVLTMALANFGPTFFWNHNNVITALAVAVNLAFGIGMIFANKQHLKSLDEMQQRIALEAMGLTLGVGLIAGLAFTTLDSTGVIGADADIAHLVVLMAVVYLATTVILNRKYR